MSENVPVEVAQDVLLELWRARSNDEERLLSDEEFFPVDVRYIIKRFLGFSFDTVDTPGVGRIRYETLHGFTDFDKKVIEVGIFPNSPGRQLFSAAHEVGHIKLHPATYGERHRPKTRRSIRTERDRAFQKREWEADAFAGALLMPSNAVKNRFLTVFGTRLFRWPKAWQFLDDGGVTLKRKHRGDLEVISEYLAEFTPPRSSSLTDFFGTSKAAMGKRIRTLGLLTQ